MSRRTPEHLGPATLPNAKSPWATTEEERQDREMFGEAHLQVLRNLLVPLLQKLERIPDPRRPKTAGSPCPRAGRPPRSARERPRATPPTVQAGRVRGCPLAARPSRRGRGARSLCPRGCTRFSAPRRRPRAGAAAAAGLGGLRRDFGQPTRERRRIGPIGRR